MENEHSTHPQRHQTWFVTDDISLKNYFIARLIAVFIVIVISFALG
jgi:hypothetical protein